MGAPDRRRAPLIGPGSPLELRRVAEILRAETVGGVLLVGAAAVALIWANSPWAAVYRALAGWRVGPTALHLDLTLAQWASDGLLAVFFFVAGLELKRELTAGDLRDPRRALLPVAAAVGGMVVPALLYLAVNAAVPGGRPLGWAVPTATDIAFALAVLAVAGRALPTALRTFLLTLAVVDDLLAIVVIAVVYTAALHPVPLLLALVPLGVFLVLVQRRVRAWWLLLPAAVATWALVHASGVHATVAGVLLGFAVPVPRRAAGPGPGLAEHFEHRFRPLSAGVAVPVFAFFAAGVGVRGAGVAGPVTAGVVVGLVLGKPVGVLGVTWLVQRLTGAPHPPWPDLLGPALLGGMGFTVSLLVGELAFGAGTPADDQAKVGVLLGSAVSAGAAAVVLQVRSRRHRHRREAPGDRTDEP